MQSPWRVIVTFAIAVAAWLAMPASAHAFHSGRTFDEPPAVGGGGGKHYLGLDAERGWDCTMCHQKAPGRLKVGISSDPPELIRDFAYEAGTVYVVTLAMVTDEELGQQSPQFNYNGMAATLVGEKGVDVGQVQGLGNDFYTSGVFVASGGTEPNALEWQIAWLTPATLTGDVSLHFAIVDGNAAGLTGDQAFNDPFDDDVLVSKIVVHPRGATAAASESPSTSTTPAGGAPWAGYAFGLGAIGLFGAGASIGRRRARRAQLDPTIQ